MKKRFTLIEIIAVIAVLGILAAIIIPNISSKKQNAMVTQVKSNIKSIQTAMDMYALDHNSQYASTIQPTMEVPQLINFELLYPKYLKSLPKMVLNEYYWVDFMGKVWCSTIDAPNELLKTKETTEWFSNKEALHYNVYNVSEINTLGSVKKPIIKVSKTIINHKDIDKFVAQTENELLISAIDKNGLETAPVGMNYRGIPEDWFQPIIQQEGTFTFEMTADEFMHWDDFYKKEDKPEGTDIIYEFSILGINGDYKPFTEDFYSLEPSKAIQIKITMIGHNGNLPSLLDFRLYYHFEHDKYQYKRSEQTIVEDKVIDKINIEEHEVISHIVFKEENINKNNIRYEFSKDNGVSFTEYSSINDIPKGSGILHIIRENSSIGSQDVLEKPIIKVSTEPIVVQDVDKKYIPVDEKNKKPNDPIVNQKGWETVQELVFVSSAADGQIAHWISVDITDKQPENTRILYRFTTSNGFKWGNYVDDFSKLSDSKMLKVYAILQVKEEFLGKVDNPEVIGIKINSSKGVTDLDMVKPTAVINTSIDNNDGREVISTSSKVDWSYEAYDPQGKKIVESVWGGDKRDNYETPGTYTVTLRLRNELNYWSNEIKYTFEVKDEKPVAVISPNKNMFSNASPTILDYTQSFDPDGDKLVNVEWSGDYNKDGIYSVGENTVKLRVQDSDGNWSDMKQLKFTITDSIFYNIGQDALDKDDSTYVQANYTEPQLIYWDDSVDLTNRIVTIKLSSDMPPQKTIVTILDKNNRVIPFREVSANTLLNSWEVTANGFNNIYSLSLVIPEGANCIKIEKTSFDVRIHSILDYSDKILPSTVSNVTHTSQKFSIALNWNNPSESDFSKVAIYRNGTFLGYFSNGTYTDAPLSQNTEYTYHIQSIDTTGNRSELLEYKATTLKADVIWSGLDPAAFDENDSTVVTGVFSTARYVTWDKDLTNRVVKIHMQGEHPSLNYIRLRILDKNGNALPFLNASTNEKVTQLLQYSNTPFVNIVMPEGAVKFELYANHPYSNKIYSIQDYPDKELPNNVSNVIDRSDTKTTITLNWIKPNDDDFSKVAIYRNGTFIGFSSNETFTDTLLTPDTEYTYHIQSIDATGNRGNKIEHKAKTMKPALLLKGIASASIDDNFSTYSTMSNSAGTAEAKYITWDGNAENRLFQISVNISSVGTSGRYFRIRVLDSNNNAISFRNPNGEGYVSSYTHTVRAGTYSLIMPKEGNKIELYATWSTNVYEIYTENDLSIRNDVSNLNYTSTTNGVTFNWTNPTDENFEKVAVYRNNAFLTYTTNNTYTQTGLTTGTAYTYSFQTIYKNGNRGNYISQIINTNTN